MGRGKGLLLLLVRAVRNRSRWALRQEKKNIILLLQDILDKAQVGEATIQIKVMPSVVAGEPSTSYRFP